MNVHEVLDYQLRVMQETLDLEAKRKVVDLLPGLTQELERLASQVLQIQSDYVRCTKVYQMPAIADGERAWKASRMLASALKAPEEMLDKAHERVVQMRLLASKLTEVWKRVRLDLDSRLGEFRRQWEQAMERLQAIAAIPDLLGTAESEAFDALTAGLRRHMHLRLADSSPATVAQQGEEWQDLVTEFEQTEQRLSFESIAQTYQLGTETVEVLRQLVEGRRVSLAQLSPKTLEELGQFQHFCEAITLRFSKS